MKRLGLLLPAMLVVVLIGCKSPAPADTPPVEAEHFPPAEHEPAAADESIVISQEMYDETLAEVRDFIDHLNTVIRNKNYNGWKDALSDELFAQISSKEFLDQASEFAILKTRKIVLRKPEDYFINVVVPSRSNSVVDEIEFTAVNKVKVFYLDKTKNENEPRRLRLYELVKIDDDTWKIIQ